MNFMLRLFSGTSFFGSRLAAQCHLNLFNAHLSATVFDLHVNGPSYQFAFVVQEKKRLYSTSICSLSLSDELQSDNNTYLEYPVSSKL
uniref:Putative secreted protein n=1 Tax=Rhipicephalus microplus TaxID=6941 RepID=A0A6G5A0X5_RHIMP